MVRYMAELGLTPSAQSRLSAKGTDPTETLPRITEILLVPMRAERTIDGSLAPQGEDGTRHERPIGAAEEEETPSRSIALGLDGRL